MRTEIEQAIANGTLTSESAKNFERSYRIRNYSAMTDQKLRRVIHELQYRGEAYFRSLERGSGDPEFDLEYAKNIARDRGLNTTSPRDF